MIPEKTVLDLDRSEKTPRQNQYRILSSWKRLSEVNLNEENQELATQVLRLRRELWQLKTQLGDEDHPFTAQVSVERVEENLGGDLE